MVEAEESQTDFQKLKCDKAVSCVKKVKERDMQTEIKTTNDKYLQTEIAVKKQLTVECQTDDFGSGSSPQPRLHLQQQLHIELNNNAQGLAAGRRRSSVQQADNVGGVSGRQHYLKGLYQQEHQLQ